MEPLTNKKELLESIRSIEGSTFDCDEKAILQAYNKEKEQPSNLAIKILSILGGFLATVSFILFLGLVGLYDSELGLIVIGSLLAISSIALNKKYDRLIIDTFSISSYISGIALLAFGLAALKVEQNLIIILISMIATSSLIITQNYILSFISIITISGSLLSLILINEFYNLIHLYIAASTLLLVFIYLNEAKIISYKNKLSKLYPPIRIGLVFTLLLGLISIGRRHLIPIDQHYIWLSSIVMILVALYIVFTIININNIKNTPTKVLVYLFSTLILASTLFSPSISGAIIIVLLSFLVNHKTSLAIGIIFIIYFVSQYYYDLNLTLLNKSILLFSSGILFLLLYFVTSKKLNSHEKI